LLGFIPPDELKRTEMTIGLGMTGDVAVSLTSGLVSENFIVSKVATLIGILSSRIRLEHFSVHGVEVYCGFERIYSSLDD
jgi:hypothetical protein